MLGEAARCGLIKGCRATCRWRRAEERIWMIRWWGSRTFRELDTNASGFGAGTAFGDECQASRADPAIVAVQERGGWNLLVG